MSRFQARAFEYLICVNLCVFSNGDIMGCNGHIGFKGCIDVNSQIKWTDRIKLTQMEVSCYIDIFWHPIF